VPPRESLAHTSGRRAPAGARAPAARRRAGRGVALAVAAALALAGALSGCGRGEAWTTVTAEDASFRVEMPGRARHARRALGTPAGQAPIEMWVREDGERAFVAGYTELPEAVRARFHPERLLDSARDGAIERVRGKLLREAPRELAGVPGRRIEIAAEGGRVWVRGDLFVRGRRLYQVLATVAPAEAESAAVRRFLDSFAFLPKAEADAPPRG